MVDNESRVRTAVDQLHAGLLREALLRQCRDRDEMLAHRAHGLERAPVAEPRLVRRERVLALRPDEPQSYRDLALVCAALRDYQRAVDLLWQVVSRPWDGRFPQIGLIALGELGFDEVGLRPVRGERRLGIGVATLGRDPVPLLRAPELGRVEVDRRDRDGAMPSRPPFPAPQ